MDASFDDVIDACQLGDEEAISSIRQKEIDILVDLKGFTKEGRPGILAGRPAPIQVNYLGYPGTMGPGYIDYIVADQIVIPALHEKYYSEKVVRVPHSYQVNDDKRSTLERSFSRSEFGLPSQGVVFCCFNKNYKLTPHQFDSWMRILGKVEGSVLWLLEDNASAAANLKREAQARGVSASRLIFAQRVRCRSIWRGIASPICSWTPCPAMRTRPPAMPCGRDCRF